MRHLFAFILTAVSLGGSEPRTSVLVELFTSEGCSSCPPADALLKTLVDSQPIDGVEVVALSEHVDYWDHLGWKDPYSAAQFSERQRTYAFRFGLNGVYTPQMVVNGAVQFVGSERGQAFSTLRSLAGPPKTGIQLTAAGGRLRVEVTPTRGTGASKAEVWLAVTENPPASRVTRGENSGRRLPHVSVVREMRRLGATRADGTFSIEIPAPESGRRAVVFVQERGLGRVLAVASLGA